MIDKFNVYGWENPAIVDDETKARWIEEGKEWLSKYGGHKPPGQSWWRSEEYTVLSGDTLLSMTLVISHNSDDNEIERRYEIREFTPRGGYSIK